MQELLIWNTLDVMHIECNISKSLLKYLFGEWDTMEVRKDLEEVGMKWHLWLHWDLSNMNYVKPLALYVFTWNERQAFLAFVSSICAQIGYATTLKKHVGPNTLYNMKSHNHHVMLENIYTSSWCFVICYTMAQEKQSSTLVLTF